MLKFKKNNILYKTFDNIYGFGIATSNFCCKFLGYTRAISITKITTTNQNSILKFFRWFIMLKFFDIKLKTILRAFYSLILHDKLYYKCFCLYNGYPMKGQRTHSNAKTPRKIKHSFLLTTMAGLCCMWFNSTTLLCLINV